MLIVKFQSDRNMDAYIFSVFESVHNSKQNCKST